MSNDVIVSNSDGNIINRSKINYIFNFDGYLNPLSLKDALQTILKYAETLESK